MSGENGKPAETPRVGDALVAALGFEPTDGDDAPDGLGDEATVSVFAASDMATSSPPKGRLFGSDAAAVDPTVSGASLATDSSPKVVIGAEGLNVDETIDFSAEEVAEMAEALKAGVDADVETAPAPDDDSDAEQHTILPESDAHLGGADSSAGTNGSAHAQSLDGVAGNGVAEADPVEGAVGPTADLAQPSNVNGTSGADVTRVAASPDLDAQAQVPAHVPVAESMPTIMPTQASVANPTIGVDAGAVSGAHVGAGVSARQGLRDQLVGDRLSSAASRLPELLDGSLLKRTRRVRARKVRRVVRHVDPWSVLTFSVLFHLCVFAALLLASVLVWNAAVAAGTIENIEDFIRDLGDYKTFEINGDVVFRAAMVIAGILTLASSLLLVLLTVVFNLISDLVGGIRVTVVEEETVRVRRRGNQ